MLRGIFTRLQRTHPNTSPCCDNQADHARSMILRSRVSEHVPTSMRSFVAVAESRPRGGIAVRLPFDPSAEWGSKDRHDVTGTVAGRKVRGRLATRRGEHYLELGPAWCRDNPIAAGDEVSVRLAPEGPQVTSMPSDVADALNSNPDARQFFESLATFYRKGFIRWIDGAKRPETRSRRIAQTIDLLKAGKREI
jgi:hypothetical protein